MGQQGAGQQGVAQQGAGQQGAGNSKGESIRKTGQLEGRDQQKGRGGKAMRKKPGGGGAVINTEQQGGRKPCSVGRAGQQAESEARDWVAEDTRGSPDVREMGRIPGGGGGGGREGRAPPCLHFSSALLHVPAGPVYISVYPKTLFSFSFRLFPGPTSFLL